MRLTAVLMFSCSVEEYNIRSTNIIIITNNNMSCGLFTTLLHYVILLSP